VKYQTKTYVTAFILASLFAAGMAGMGWIFNQSPLPPGGGGWKLTIATPVGTWVVIFLLVVVDRKVRRPRKFSLDKQDVDRQQ